MVSRRVSRSAALGFVVLACPWFLSACAESGTAAPRGKEAAAKSVKTEAVREEAVHRTVEVVGTLAAEDEVTISSQAEGVVKRVLADLGDPVKAGQPLVELDREKLQYNLDQQKAALARALTKYGASDSDHLPPVEETPDVQKGGRRTGPGQAGQRTRRRTAQADADSAAVARRCQGDASVEAGVVRLGAAERARTFGADIDVADATREARGSPAARRLHSRAVRRLRAEADGVGRRARQERDAGHDGRPGRSAEGAGGDSRAHGARGSRSASRSTSASTRFRTRRSPATSRASVPAVNTATRTFSVRSLGAQPRRAC